VQDAQKLAHRTGAFVLQANWPMSLNYPERGAKSGRSVVIGPDGAIHFELPQAAAGFGLFTLGSTRFDWHADES
jgi:omega-amidase